MQDYSWKVKITKDLEQHIETCSNENSHASHHPQVDGVENYPIDLDPVTLTYDF